MLFQSTATRNAWECRIKRLDGLACSRMVETKAANSARCTVLDGLQDGDCGEVTRESSLNGMVKQGEALAAADLEAGCNLGAGSRHAKIASYTAAMDAYASACGAMTAAAASRPTEFQVRQFVY